MYVCMYVCMCVSVYGYLDTFCGSYGKVSMHMHIRKSIVLQFLWLGRNLPRQILELLTIHFLLRDIAHSR